MGQNGQTGENILDVYFYYLTGTTDKKLTADKRMGRIEHVGFGNGATKVLI